MSLLLLETWKGLLAPKRLIAILAICIPLTIVQQELWDSPWSLPMIVLIIFLLLLIAPVAYRWLLDPALPARTAPLRLLVYVLLGTIAPALLYLLPRWLDLQSFVSTKPTMFISAGLFWVAGYGLGRDIDLEERWMAADARARELSQKAEHAQLMALRAQLDPHFLFNTLNAIAEWCREDPIVAEKAILSLSDLLRKVLSGVQTMTWPLSSELAAIRQLLELHQIRDPQRFQIEWSVAPEMDNVPIPPLLLLPLAENAMKHGPGRGHRGVVQVEVKRAGLQVTVSIENPGTFTGRRIGGEGLKSVEQRVLLAYGAKGTFSIEAVGERTRAVVSFDVPARGAA